MSRISVLPYTGALTCVTYYEGHCQKDWQYTTRNLPFAVQYFIAGKIGMRDALAAVNKGDNA